MQGGEGGDAYPPSALVERSVSFRKKKGIKKIYFATQLIKSPPSFPTSTNFFLMSGAVRRNAFQDTSEQGAGKGKEDDPLALLNEDASAEPLDNAGELHLFGFCDFFIPSLRFRLILRFGAAYGSNSTFSFLSSSGSFFGSSLPFSLFPSPLRPICCFCICRRARTNHRSIAGVE